MSLTKQLNFTLFSYPALGNVHTVMIKRNSEYACRAAVCKSSYFLPRPLQQQYMFLLHSEQERESWISSIKKLQPKGEVFHLVGWFVRWSEVYTVCSCGLFNVYTLTKNVLCSVLLPDFSPAPLFYRWPISLSPPLSLSLLLSPLPPSLPPLSAVRSVSFNPLELQDLLNRQTISELRKIEEVTQPVLGMPLSLHPSSFL